MDRKPFDKKRSDEGIKAACEAFDALDLTLMERWWALRCLEVSARALLGEKVMEYVQNEEEKMQSSGEKPEDGIIEVAPAGD